MSEERRQLLAGRTVLGFIEEAACDLDFEGGGQGRRNSRIKVEGDDV